MFISQDFMNEQLKEHVKSELIKEIKISFEPEDGQIFLRGVVQVPTEEMRAVNLDPALGAFRFQAAIKLEATKQGHLVIEFPINETYFYPAGSKDPKTDRVVMPVQLLSLALASARGYLSALSGDFSGFDRRTAKLTALKKGLERLIKTETNADALKDLKNQREALTLQIAAIPIERKQLETAAKQFEHLLGFTGEKELNLNDELAARRNALVLKIKLAQLTPYLQGTELGGIRIVHDKKDGNGENYFVLDVNSELTVHIPDVKTQPSSREGMKLAPSLIMRLNQSMFESEELARLEKEKMGSSLRNLTIELKDDGVHVAGTWHKFFINVPFETTVDLVSTASDVFEARVRELEVGGIDFEFLSKFVLEAMQNRLDHALKGRAKFKYVGVEKDHSRALQVTVDPKQLVPAFPDLHLLSVDVRDKEFLLKIGHDAPRAEAITQGQPAK